MPQGNNITLAILLQAHDKTKKALVSADRNLNKLSKSQVKNTKDTKKQKQETEKLTKELEQNTKEVNKNERAQKKKGGVLKTLRGKYLGITAAIAGVTYSLGKMFGSMGASEKRMSNLGTLTGANTELLRQMELGVRDLAKRSVVSLAELETELYNVASAMGASTDNIAVLEAGAKLANVGVGSLSSSIDALTTSLNAFEIDASQAEQVAGTLFLAIRGGKMTIDELASALSRVAPVASGAGLQIADVATAFQFVTSAGTKAAEAGTQMKAFLQYITKDTKAWSSALGTVGLTVHDVRAGLQEHGLIFAMETLNDISNQGVNIFDIFAGNAEALAFGQTLLKTSIEEYEQALQRAIDGSSILNEEYIRSIDNLPDLIQLAKNGLNVALQQLGDYILPSVKELLVAFIDEMRKPGTTNTIKSFGKFIIFTFGAIVSTIHTTLVGIKSLAWGFITYLKLLALGINNVLIPALEAPLTLVKGVARGMKFLGLVSAEKADKIINLDIVPRINTEGITKIQQGLEESIRGNIEKASENAKKTRSRMNAIDAMSQTFTSVARAADEKRKQTIQEKIAASSFGSGGSVGGTTKDGETKTTPYKLPEGFRKWSSNFRQSYAHQLAAQQQKNAISEEITKLAKKGTFFNMGYEQRMAQAQKIAGRHNLATQDFASISGLASQIERASDGAMRELERKAQERAREKAREKARATATRTRAVASYTPKTYTPTKTTNIQNQINITIRENNILGEITQEVAEKIGDVILNEVRLSTHNVNQ